MNGEAASIFMDNFMNPPSPLFKLRTDIFKEGVEVDNGSGEEEKEEGELDTSLISISSDEFPTESAISSFVSQLRTEAGQSPPPPPTATTRKEKRNVVEEMTFLDPPLLESNLQLLYKSIEEKRKKIAQLENEITTDKSKIERISKWRISRHAMNLRSQKIQKKKNKQERVCELCSVIVYDENSWQSHLNGKKHEKRELEEREIVVLG